MREGAQSAEMSGRLWVDQVVKLLLRGDRESERERESADRFAMKESLLVLDASKCPGLSSSKRRRRAT